jgi:hypothetical protein
MEYNDHCLRLSLPLGFSFHSRPNYRTWNFARGKALMCVLTATGDEIGELERVVTYTSLASDPGVAISGPHVLELKTFSAVYRESVKQIPEFYNKEVQVALRGNNFCAFVTVNDESPYQISDYLPCLESIEISAEEVESSRDTYMPDRWGGPADGGRGQRAGESSVELRGALRYLQPVVDELSSVSPEDLGVNAASFLPYLEDAVRQRIAGLSLEDAEELIEADHHALVEWANRTETTTLAVRLILGWLSPFLVAQLLEPDDDR